MILFLFSQIRWTWQYICRFGTRYSTGQCCQCICSVTIASITYSSIECTADSPFLFLVSSTASVVSSTISSIDVLGEDLTNHRFGRLYRRWLKCANRTMKQNLRQVREKNHIESRHSFSSNLCSRVVVIVDVLVSHLLSHFLRMTCPNTGINRHSH